MTIIDIQLFAQNLKQEDIYIVFLWIYIRVFFRKTTVYYSRTIYEKSYTTGYYILICGMCKSQEEMKASL